MPAISTRAIAVVSRLWSGAREKPAMPHIGLSEPPIGRLGRPKPTRPCPERDSNPHTLGLPGLSRPRLPVPPSGPSRRSISRGQQRDPMQYVALGDLHRSEAEP